MTWTNDRAITYNNVIRKHIHQTENLINFVNGDCVVFNDFYCSPFDESVFYTSDIVKITKLVTEKKTLFEWETMKIETPKNPIDTAFNALLTRLDAVHMTFKVDCPTVEKIHSDIDVAFNHSYHQIQTINRTELKLYEETQETIRIHLESFYKKHRSDSHSTKLWTVFHKNIRDAYANIIFSYSMTTHKSQASTFSDVFVDVADISMNIKTDEMQRCLYTAASRASNELSFIIA